MTSTSLHKRSAQRGLSMPPLVRYLLMRLGLAFILLVGVTLVTFVLTNLVPADPVQAALGERAAGDPELVAAYRAKLGLDRPLPVQYFLYLAALLQGDLGTSIVTRRPIADEIMSAFPATVELALVAVLVSVLIGLALGMVAAIKKDTFTDQFIRLTSLVGISWPAFWLALVVYYVFYYLLGIAPGSGRLNAVTVPPPNVTGMYTIDSLLSGQIETFWEALSHLVLPSLVLALFAIGVLTRFTRSAVLEVLSLDYVRAARAKGLTSSRVLFGYVLRGALLPTLTVIGVLFGSLLAGAVLVEQVFAWHGLGQYSFKAATTLDLPAIMAVGLVIGVVYILLNLLVDVLYGLIDPRVRQA